MNSPDAAARTPVIAFIGGGQMASALAGGLLKSGWQADRILVVEPFEAQREKVSATLGVKALAAADASVSSADVVVWAVKPQVLCAAIEPVTGLLRAPLHISIVAGISSPVLSRWLGSDRVIRTMPNTPALVGAGVTGMLAMAGVAPADRQLAERLMAATGHTFWVDSDDRIDAVTAVTGSGPGYVFQFLESFQAAAQALGFPAAQARELVLRTVAGAAQQAAADDTPFSTLRERVTSKGGTTQAGLEVLASHGVPAAVSQAVSAAYHRAQELSTQLSHPA